METQSPPKKRRHSPLFFGPCLLWPNGLMDQDATWYRGRPQSSRHYCRWGPNCPLKRGTAPLTFWPVSIVDPAPSLKWGTAPNFRPMSIVAKRSPILATAEYMFNTLHFCYSIFDFIGAFCFAFVMLGLVSATLLC